MQVIIKCWTAIVMLTNSCCWFSYLECLLNAFVATCLILTCQLFSMETAMTICCFQPNRGIRDYRHVSRLDSITRVFRSLQYIDMWGCGSFRWNSSTEVQGWFEEDAVSPILPVRLARANCKADVIWLDELSTIQFGVSWVHSMQGNRFNDVVV